MEVETTVIFDLGFQCVLTQAAVEVETMVHFDMDYGAF